MLAYVFWHWRADSIERSEYKERVLAFQQAMHERKVEGLHTSLVWQLASVPWLGTPDEVYEEWYLLDGAASLDPLNHAAVHGLTERPHTEVAQKAAGGTAALYQLYGGEPFQARTGYNRWFGKPAGMSYEQFFSRVMPMVERDGGCLWQRYMTLGPAPEFCWQCADAHALITEFDVLTLAVERV
jgi:hypothetical protein